MTMKVATNLDLLKNEVQNFKVHISTSDLASPVEAGFYYNSTAKTLRFYNGSAWVEIGYLNQMTATGAISVNNQLISSLATPISPNDAATKAYVDTVSQGLSGKDSTLCATTGNITLVGAQTIDGISVVAGDRVLVKNQTLPSENGIYVVSASTWARSIDADTWDELKSAFAFVEKGDTLADTGWLCTVDPGGTLGTTAVTWVQFSAAGQITASNLVGSGGTTASIFRAKVGTDLQFRQIVSPSGQGAVTVVQNTNDIAVTASAKIEALHDNASNGLIAQTGASTWAARSVVAPAAGMTVTNGNGVAGNPTLVLANDLAALEALASTGIAVRTGTDAWAQRTITAGTGITVTNGNGVSGNPTIATDNAALQTAGFVKKVAVVFSFVSNGTDIAIAHNLALSSPSELLITVRETASQDIVYVDRSTTAWKANIAYIKMYGGNTTASYYTATVEG